jgi:hypothetical protein
MKPTINFDILETYDQKVMRILDTSDWKHLKGVDTFLDITLPSRTNAVTKEVTQGAISVFNAWNLGLVSEPYTETPLPDGVYKIRLYICDEEDKFSTTKYVLRTVKLMHRLDELLMELDLCCSLPRKTAVEKYFEIYLLLKSAHANTRQGNLEQAMCEWNKAKELMDDYEHCIKDKNCGKNVWL